MAPAQSRKDSLFLRQTASWHRKSSQFAGRQVGIHPRLLAYQSRMTSDEPKIPKAGLKIHFEGDNSAGKVSEQREAAVFNPERGAPGGPAL